MNKILAPSILSADFRNLESQIKTVEEAGAGFIHCDIMDGQFVPNLTFGSIVIEAVKKCTSLPLDVHLMIKNPDALIPDFIKAGADIITVHAEEVVHLDRSLNRIKELGAKAGVAINPSTPVEVLSEILDIADLILVMSVNPGFGGQKFIPNSLKKIKKLADWKKGYALSYMIEVDGGVSLDNVKTISEAGCEVFVAGSSVYGSENINNTIKKFLEII
ncbi:MAG: ribulose-phosphate 3-epimerase [Ignavibacteriales bacterium]|nr:ribulose-phosphate 3-epimerase [Ignavibacteriales bacterium]